MDQSLQKADQDSTKRRCPFFPSPVTVSGRSWHLLAAFSRTPLTQPPRVLRGSARVRERGPLGTRRPRAPSWRRPWTSWVRTRRNRRRDPRCRHQTDEGCFNELGHDEAEKPSGDDWVLDVHDHFHRLSCLLDVGGSRIA